MNHKMAGIHNIVKVSLNGPRGQAARQLLQERDMLINREDDYEIVKQIGSYRYNCVLDEAAQKTHIYPVHQVFGEVTGLVKVPEDHADVCAMMETLVTYMKNEFSAVSWDYYG